MFCLLYQPTHTIISPTKLDVDAFFPLMLVLSFTKCAADEILGVGDTAQAAQQGSEDASTDGERRDDTGSDFELAPLEPMLPKEQQEEMRNALVNHYK